MSGGFDKDEVRRLRAEADQAALFQQDGHAMESDGKDYVAVCPFHRDDTPSLHIYADGDRGWYCFGCGAHGDAIEYLTRYRRLTFGQALDVLRGGPKLSGPVKWDRRREHDVIMPVPNGQTSHFRMSRATGLGDPTAVWWYLSAFRERLFAVVRYPQMDGGRPVLDEDGNAKKSIRTWCWARRSDGSAGWACTRPAERIPLYGLDRLADRPGAPVLLVEGEKTADAAQALFPQLCVVTWCGGSKSIVDPKRVDWSPLKGRSVTLVPDCDKSGAFCMIYAAAWIREAGGTVAAVVQLGGQSLPQGWDLADAKTVDEAAAVLAKQVTADPDAALAVMMSTLPGKLDEKPAAKALALVAKQPRTTAEIAEDEAAPDLMDTDEAGPGEAGGGDGGDGPPAAGGGEGDRPDRNIEAGDIEAASRFVEMHGNDVRYCPSLKRWFVWDGTMWEPDQESGNVVFRKAELTALAMAKDLMEQADELRTEAEAKREEGDEDRAKVLHKAASAATNAAKAIQKRSRMVDMLGVAETRPEVCIRFEQLDARDHLIGAADGIIDLHTGDVWGHDPKWLITRKCAAPYDKARMTALRTTQPDGHLGKVLRHVFKGDADVIRFVQLSLGRSLFAFNALEKLYLLQGPGRSGKGTLMEGVKAALGGYCGVAEFQSFVQQDGQRVRDDLHRLMPFNLVIASEADRGQRLACALLKQLTGMDTVTTRGLYGSYSEARPRFTIWLQANDKPAIPDDDMAMWARMTLIPTGLAVPEEDRDPGLKTWMIDPERGGREILAWLVAGAVEAHALKRIPEPAAIKEANYAYRMEQDQSREFREEILRFPAMENREWTGVSIEDFHNAWKAWCAQEGIPERFRMKPKKVMEKLIEDYGCWKEYDKSMRSGSGSPAMKNRVRHLRGVTLSGEHALLEFSHCPTDEEHRLRVGCATAQNNGGAPIITTRTNSSPSSKSLSREIGNTDQNCAAAQSLPPLPNPDADDPTDGGGF